MNCGICYDRLAFISDRVGCSRCTIKYHYVCLCMWHTQKQCLYCFQPLQKPKFYMQYLCYFIIMLMFLEYAVFLYFIKNIMIVSR